MRERDANFQKRFKELAKRRAQENSELKDKIKELEDERGHHEDLKMDDEEHEKVDEEKLEIEGKLQATETELQELKLINENLASELMAKEQSFQRDRVTLTKEIESLKEQLASKQKTYEELERALELQKQANLSTHDKHQTESDERVLIQKERAEKAEMEVEVMRAAKLQASDDLSKAQRDLADAKLKLGQRDIELNQLKQEAAMKIHESQERKVMMNELQSLQARLLAAEKLITALREEKKQVEAR